MSGASKATGARSLPETRPRRDVVRGGVVGQPGLPGAFGLGRTFKGIQALPSVLGESSISATTPYLAVLLTETDI